MFQNLSNQKKGSLLAFIGVMFITPDSLFIRLANADTYQLLFYRGSIPFVTVLIALLVAYKSNFIRIFLNTGYPGIAYSLTFALTNITFIISIQNTNVANTLVMVALAPMLSAILSLIFLKENPEKKTWVAIIITTLAAIYIFYDSIQIGNFFGDIFGLITATGLAAGAVIIRSAKKRNLVPSAVVGKLIVAIVAAFFVKDYELLNNDLIIVPAMCVLCVAIPFVLVTIAPRFITAAEVNLFFLLETILGPIWVWLVIKEQPSFETILGGLLIIITITIHSILVIKKT
tara:strand:- start:1391 stop:2254 length:864 start_codon:yes stop_codon:yes gene_type:complete